MRVPYLRRSILLLQAIVLIAFCVSACTPSNHIPTEIIEARIGDQTYYIPKAYLNFPHTSIGQDSVLLQAYYPGAAIVPSDENELWKQGQWWKNVRILGNYYKNSKISFDSLVKENIESLKAYQVISDEYGLIHQAQPKGYVQDHWDIWLEKDGNNFSSYITCSEKILTTDTPQCSHHFRLSQKFILQVSYDKKLLPQWKIIQRNIEELFASFQSKEIAQKYLEQKIMENKSIRLQENE